MKNIITAVTIGLILFASHALYAKLCYSNKDIVDLTEKEVKEID